MITNMMIKTPRGHAGQITSRKVSQSHFLMATDSYTAHTATRPRCGISSLLAAIRLARWRQ